jgi:hypothetical protein
MVQAIFERAKAALSSGRFAMRAIKALSLGIVLSATPAAAVIDPAHEFITNGGFENLSNGLGQLTRNTTAVGWTSATTGGNYGFTYAFNTSSASSTGSPGEVQERLWGPNNGSNNGLSASPTGGNFIGADGAYHVSRLSQTITGLIVGETYTLTFDFAGAQEYGTTGSQTEGWKYGFASQGANPLQQTDSLNNASKGFTGWESETYNFVATSTSDTLYFLAKGTPSGQPPMSLLDSVSLVGAFGTVSAAPDPATWMTMLVGFGIVGASLRRRPRRNANSNRSTRHDVQPGFAAAIA